MKNEWTKYKVDISIDNYWPLPNDIYDAAKRQNPHYNVLINTNMRLAQCNLKSIKNHKEWSVAKTHINTSNILQYVHEDTNNWLRKNTWPAQLHN